MSYEYIWRIIFTTIHHFWDFTVQQGGSGAAGRAWWIYAVRCSYSARYITQQPLAICNFLTNRQFSKKNCRAAWIEDLYNILNFFFPEAFPFNAERCDFVPRLFDLSLSLFLHFITVCQHIVGKVG